MARELALHRAKPGRELASRLLDPSAPRKAWTPGLATHVPHCVRTWLSVRRLAIRLGQRSLLGVGLPLKGVRPQ